MVAGVRHRAPIDLQREVPGRRDPRSASHIQLQQILSLFSVLLPGADHTRHHGDRFPQMLLSICELEPGNGRYLAVLYLQAFTLQSQVS